MRTFWRMKCLWMGGELMGRLKWLAGGWDVCWDSEVFFVVGWMGGLEY